MPSPVLKKYAKQTGKSLKEVEDAWEECRAVAKNKFKEESDSYWAYTNACTRKKIGLDKDK